MQENLTIKQLRHKKKVSQQKMLRNGSRID